MYQVIALIALLIAAPSMESVVPASPAFVFGVWLVWVMVSIMAPKEDEA